MRGMAWHGVAKYSDGVGDDSNAFHTHTHTHQTFYTEKNVNKEKNNKKNRV